MPDEYRTSLVSVIIVNFNGKRFLQDCLSSLLKQTYPPFEVILVDNASHDGSVEFVQEHFPHGENFQSRKKISVLPGVPTQVSGKHTGNLFSP